MADEDRRKFLKVATCAIGGGIGAALGVPALVLSVDPATRETVTGPTAPIDVGSAEEFRLGASPRRVELIAPIVRNGWTAARNVVLGAAWVQRTGADAIVALSAVCPHLGCAVAWDSAAKNFLCPCHESRFGVDGTKLTGPSERGLDTLPVAVVDGRLQLTWVRYKLGQSARELA